ncbi:MAG: hypothetical protein KGL39_26185 [Patescibacteria group bacterium]|nr:hypothetical protein [Patescibacteria group bacterium]
MHFQLYIPHPPGPSAGLLEQAGLADFVAGAESLDVEKGPDGNRGVVFAWRRPGQAQMGYQPAKQTWLPAVPRDGLAAGRYWLGIWNDSAPTPADIARPYPRPGRSIELADGNPWLLPIAKELPADLILQDDGSWKFEIQRRFHAFYIEHLRWAELFVNASEGTTYEFAEAANFVLSALRINYRLVPELASHVRLLNTDNVTACLFAILGAAA